MNKVVHEHEQENYLWVNFEVKSVNHKWMHQWIKFVYPVKFSWRVRFHFSQHSTMTGLNWSTDESGDFFALKTKASWYAESIAYDMNPLNWFRDNEKDYVALAVYAKRIFSIPACSTSCERVFSRMKDLLSGKRAGKKDATLRAETCLGSHYRDMRS